jgi:hypothetical protein
MNWLSQGRRTEPLPTPDPLDYARGILEGALGQISDLCNSGLIRVNDPLFGVRYEQVELTEEQEESVKEILASLAWIKKEREEKS